VILASASPRRREILSALGIRFEIVVPSVDELTAGEPEKAVVENARRKARAIHERVGGRDPILAADTEVVLDGRILGKAGNEMAARERLEALSGRTHAVLTGLVILSPGEGGGDPIEHTGVAHSEVTFRKLSPSLLDAYLASGEWRDRAGAYAVQGLGATLVEHVDGDLSNVIGMPVTLLLELAPELVDVAGDLGS
jgi:septum formation protein